MSQKEKKENILKEQKDIQILNGAKIIRKRLMS